MVNRIQKLIANKALLYTLMSIVASGINFITLIIFGKVFSVVDYGSVTTLQAFVSNVAVFVTPQQLMICKAISEGAKERAEELTGIFNIFLIINVIEVALMAMAAEGLGNYLHISNGAEYFWVLVLLLLNNIFVIMNGIMQGQQNFLLMGKISIILYTVKMVLGVAFGLLDMGPVAVILGFAFAEIICLSIMLKVSWGNIRNQLKDYKFCINRTIFKYYIETFVLYVVVSLYMNNGDILLANLYCDKGEIGLYSVAINLSKISVFLIATPVATILLPKVASKSTNVTAQKRLLFIAEGITLGISLLYGLLFGLLGKWIIPVLYGELYAGASEYIFQCVIFSSILGVFWVFYQYALVTNLLKPFVVISLILGILTVVGVIFVQCPIEWIPVLMSLSMVLTVCIVLLYTKLTDGGHS